MPYCWKCGARLGEEARYCPSCGAYVAQPERRVERVEKKRNGVKIILLVFGGLFLLGSFGLFIAGGLLLSVNSELTGSSGFISTNGYRFQKDSYAITFQHIKLNLGEEWWWSPSAQDIVTVKVTSFNNNLSKNVFVGIARESDVESYLGNVNYDEITRFSVSARGVVTVEYTRHAGELPLGKAPLSPVSQTFWTASIHGTGTQALEWTPETGNYWIVLMNADASAGLDTTVTVGVRISLLIYIRDVSVDWRYSRLSYRGRPDLFCSA